MWNGTAEILKARPASRKTRPEDQAEPGLARARARRDPAKPVWPVKP
jgi:hypothetical protein